MSKKIIKVDVNQTIINKANILAARHTNYVEQFVTRGNNELYAILAETMALYEQVESNPQRDKIVERIRKYLRQELNIKTQTNSKTTALVAKLVTRASRKTAHIYGRVLEVAVANGITSTGLVDYIKSMGGIEKVRIAVNTQETEQLKKQEKQITKVVNNALTKHLSNKQAIGEIDFSPINNRLPHTSDVTFTHLLCTFNHVTGKHEVVSVMYPSVVLETQALNEYVTMLGAACRSDSSKYFHEYCKDYGLNMDLILRWMHANGIKDADQACTLYKSFYPAAVSNQDQLKKAA